MADSSVWIGYFRPKTPAAVKSAIEQIVRAEEMALCEPVVFETLRAAPRTQRAVVVSVFDTYPVLDTLPSLWTDALRVGQACVDRGFVVPGLDLLVAQACLHHQAELVTFDRHYELIARVSPLRAHVLDRPA